MFLQVPHRMESSLAAWVGDVLFPGTLLVSMEKAQFMAQRSVTFVPVTSPTDAHGRARKPAREAACLEIDLAAGRGTERVPQELLSGLVRHGFANYLEAQAVVRTLEKLHSTTPRRAASASSPFMPARSN